MAWQPQIVEIHGAFASASNATLLCSITDGERVIYKPDAGVRPLWDFSPHSLAVREVLAYRVDQALGFDSVPETVLGDGPYGPGIVQRFVDQDHSVDPVALVQDGDPRLWPVAVLDLVTNNADRKIGHVLIEAGTGVVRSIDHGLTFHEDDKLRTVLWAFAGRELPDEMVQALRRLRGALEDWLAAEVADRLGRGARAALTRRVEGLAEVPRHPHPPSDRPAVPWPPY